MSGKPIVFLEDIADKLEETMEHWEQYLNTATGEFVAISDGAYTEVDEELMEKKITPAIISDCRTSMIFTSITI